jgi:hypothetical protein
MADFIRIAILGLGNVGRALARADKPEMSNSFWPVPSGRALANIRANPPYLPDVIGGTFAFAKTAQAGGYHAVLSDLRGRVPRGNQPVRRL